MKMTIITFENVEPNSDVKMVRDVVENPSAETIEYIFEFCTFESMRFDPVDGYIVIVNYVGG